MESIKLKLEQGKVLLAELEMRVEDGTSPLSVHYTCIIDQEESSAIRFENIPRRIDPLQIATDALYAFGYRQSGRKPGKLAKVKTKPGAPQL